MTNATYDLNTVSDMDDHAASKEAYTYGTYSNYQGNACPMEMSDSVPVDFSSVMGDVARSLDVTGAIVIDSTLGPDLSSSETTSLVQTITNGINQTVSSLKVILPQVSAYADACWVTPYPCYDLSTGQWASGSAEFYLTYNPAPTHIHVNGSVGLPPFKYGPNLSKVLKIPAINVTLDVDFSAALAAQAPYNLGDNILHFRGTVTPTITVTLTVSAQGVIAQGSLSVTYTYNKPLPNQVAVDLYPPYPVNTF